MLIYEYITFIKKFKENFQKKCYYLHKILQNYKDEYGYLYAPYLGIIYYGRFAIAARYSLIKFGGKHL